MTTATNPYDVPRFRMMLCREPSAPPPLDVKGPEEIARALAFLADEDRENFVVVGLDSQHRIIGTMTVHVGTGYQAVISGKDVFKAALLMNAQAVVLAHNHPSGVPEPSPEDISLTRLLADLGTKLDVPVVDHVIIGEADEFVSFSRRGLLR